MLYVTEYAFICLLKERNEDTSSRKRITPIYVSKEYNVGLLPGSYKPARFLFGEYNIGLWNEIFLAEEPAKVTPNGNIELEYLRLRKHRSVGKAVDGLPNAVELTHR